MVVLANFYEHVLEIQNKNQKEEVVSQFCAIIANIFLTDDYNMLQDLINPDLKIVDFLNKLLEEYQDDNWMMSEILYPLNNIAASKHTRQALIGSNYVKTLKNYTLNDPASNSIKVLQLITWGLSNY